jgi:hypothetical protein
MKGATYTYLIFAGISRGMPVIQVAVPEIKL